MPGRATQYLRQPTEALARVGVCPFTPGHAHMHFMTFAYRQRSSGNCGLERRFFGDMVALDVSVMKDAPVVACARPKADVRRATAAQLRSGAIRSEPPRLGAFGLVSGPPEPLLKGPLYRNEQRRRLKSDGSRSPSAARFKIRSAISNFGISVSRSSGRAFHTSSSTPRSMLNVSGS
jgi:hypothetical protein